MIWILTLLLSCQVLVAAATIQSQELQTPKLSQGRTYNRRPGSRILAPKVQRYPILEQLEYLLYPLKDFSKQKPRARLERLEIAVWGDKQKGSVAKRLDKLQQETESWQIANQQVSNLLNQDTLAQDSPNKSHAYISPEVTAKQIAYHQPQARARQHYKQQPFVIQSNKSKQVDYDYQNYRLVTPIIKHMGQRGVSEMFRRKR